jgi:hypothetical protein
VRPSHTPAKAAARRSSGPHFSRDSIWVQFRSPRGFFWLSSHHGTLNSRPTMPMLSQSLVPAPPPRNDDLYSMTQRHIMQKIAFQMVTSPSPPSVFPRPPSFSPPATTPITSIAASFASTIYSHEALLSPAIVSRQNGIILLWLANEPYQLPTPTNTSTGPTLSSTKTPARD